LPEEPLPWKEVGRALFRTPTALLLMAVFLGANFVATIFLTWTPTFLVEKFHFKLTAAGLSGSVFIHLASAASVPVGGILADRLTRRRAGGRMLVQALGLLAGSGPVFFVGITDNVNILLLAMTLFGLCKGLYDSNIFASLYDVIEPRARATAAGLMNTVGWGGGALGPLFVGWAAQNGRHATEVENMSEAIAACGAVYLVGAALLFVAILFFARRDSLILKRPGHIQ
jgi:sugar phosphate permease